LTNIVLVSFDLHISMLRPAETTLIERKAHLKECNATDELTPPGMPEGFQTDVVNKDRCRSHRFSTCFGHWRGCWLLALATDTSAVTSFSRC
jgi:hypothetical protein